MGEKDRPTTTACTLGAAGHAPLPPLCHTVPELRRGFKLKFRVKLYRQMKGNRGKHFDVARFASSPFIFNLNSGAACRERALGKLSDDKIIVSPQACNQSLGWRKGETAPLSPPIPTNFLRTNLQHPRGSGKTRKSFALETNVFRNAAFEGILLVRLDKIVCQISKGRR